MYVCVSACTRVRVCVFPAPWANAEMLRLDGEEEDPACSQSGGNPNPHPDSSLKSKIWNLIGCLHRRRADTQSESEKPTAAAAAAAKVPVITIKTLDIQLVSSVLPMRHDGKKAFNINKYCWGFFRSPGCIS